MKYPMTKERHEKILKASKIIGNKILEVLDGELIQVGFQAVFSTLQFLYHAHPEEDEGDIDNRKQILRGITEWVHHESQRFKT
jgi:hypothetical protein